MRRAVTQGGTAGRARHRFSEAKRKRWTLEWGLKLEAWSLKLCNKWTDEITDITIVSSKQHADRSLGWQSGRQSDRVWLVWLRFARVRPRDVERYESDSEQIALISEGGGGVVVVVMISERGCVEILCICHHELPLTCSGLASIHCSSLKIHPIPIIINCSVGLWR
jgi:hypothetical protein